MVGPVNVDLPLSKSPYPFRTNILIVRSEAQTVLIEAVRLRRKPKTVCRLSLILLLPQPAFQHSNRILYGTGEMYLYANNSKS